MEVNKTVILSLYLKIKCSLDFDLQVWWFQQILIKVMFRSEFKRLSSSIAASFIPCVFIVTIGKRYICEDSHWFSHFSDSPKHFSSNWRTREGIVVLLSLITSNAETFESSAGLPTQKLPLVTTLKRVFHSSKKKKVHQWSTTVFVQFSLH